MEITMPHKEKASEMKHYAGKAVFSAAIGHALDGLDLMILSFALSGIIATFGVDNATAGSLTSITLAGAFLGGLVFGTLADKLGRHEMPAALELRDALPRTGTGKLFWRKLQDAEFGRATP